MKNIFKNKINNSIIKCSILILLLIGSVGCSIDEIEPEYLLTENNVVNNRSSAQALLNKTYISFRSFNLIALFGGQELASGYQAGVFFGSVGFAENDVQTDNLLVTGIYREMYLAINNSNFLIDQLEKGNAKDMSEGEVALMLAEAKTLRGYAHFLLLRTYGYFFDLNSQYGIVVSQSPIRGFEEFPRKTVQESYDAIIADLTFGANKGSDRRETFYVSAITAKSILANVYLYMGDYTNAASTALDVINSPGGYALSPTYKDIYSDKLNSTEVLFAPFLNGFSGEGYGNPFTFSSFSASSSPLFIALADAQDPAPGNQPLFTEGYDSRFIDTYRFDSGAAFGNFKYIITDFLTEAALIYHMRLAEVYLIHAEAEARRSGGDLNVALGSLNTIRQRANMPDRVLSDKATLLEDIRTEKLLEIFAENGTPWFDLVRYDRLGDLDATTIKPELNNVEKMVLPIPRDARGGNTKLEQNPGYTDN